MNKKERLVYIQWVVIFVLAVLVSLLLTQNLNYKKKYSWISKQPGLLNPGRLVGELEKNLLFETFPIGLGIGDFHFSDGCKALIPGDYLVMVFDLNMCGKCLYHALDILGYYREMAGQKGISLLAIAGVKDKREESEIIGLHDSGALFFPVKIMKKGELFGDLKITEPDLIDTPVFFYLDKDFWVLDVFKPGYLKTEELYRWLSLILD